MHTTIKALSTFPAPSSTLPLNRERIFLAASQRDAQCSVHCSPSFLPVPICPILSLCVFVFGVYGLMCFLKFMCLFVLCSCYNTCTRAFLPSQFRSPFDHAKAYFHASVHSHLFVSCSREALSRKRKSPETLAKKTVTVSEYLSPESLAVNLFGKTASPSNFSCLECLP